MLEEETDVGPESPAIKWQWFEYVNMKLADGQEKRKLQIVFKETAAGELFKYLKTLLKNSVIYFPTSH